MNTFPCWVIFYHYLRAPAASDGAGIRALTIDEFSEQLDWLAARADIISYPAFADAVDHQRGFRRPSVLLTFDDGLVDHYDAAFAELKRREMTGVFFVNGDPLNETPQLVNVHRTHLLLDHLGPARLLAEVRRLVTRDVRAGRVESADVYRYDGQPEQVVKRLLNYELPYAEVDCVLGELVAEHLGDEREIARRFYLSRADVRDMAAAGMTFGYHTRQHRVLSRLDESAQAAELDGGVTLVQELTGQGGVPFCYPYGHRHTFDGRTTRLLDALGYDMAFTTGRQPAHPERDRRFEIPRFDTVDLSPRGNMTIDSVQGSPP